LTEFESLLGIQGEEAWREQRVVLCEKSKLINKGKVKSFWEVNGRMGKIQSLRSGDLCKWIEIRREREQGRREEWATPGWMTWAMVREGSPASIEAEGLTLQIENYLPLISDQAEPE